MSRARNTTTAPTGSVAPLGLRLLPELRDKIESAARTNGRSLNAEVSSRLQASFEPKTTERIQDLELEISKQRMATAEERDKAIQYSLALMAVAAHVPPAALANSPTVAAIVKEVTTNRNAKMLAAAHQMLADAVQTVVDIDQKISDSQTKPVKTQDAKKIKRP